MIIVVLIVFISTLSFSQSGWIQVTDPISNLDIMAIQFTSANTGYASGSYNTQYPGAFLRTTNAGMNWQVTQFLTHSADDLCFLDDNTGYLIGWSTVTLNSFVFKTTNGGVNWVCKDSLQSSFFKIKFYDYNTGFIAAKNNAGYKTTNGGDNWLSQTGAVWHEPTTLCCIDANTWLVSSGLSIISKTTNGGINWSILDFASIGMETTAMYFINHTTGFCATWYGKIFKTTNTGNNWFQISTIDTFTSYGNMMFLNDNIGYISGAGIYKTTNGGYNWSNQVINPITTIRSLYFINSNTGYAGGINGIIFKTTTGGSVSVANISNEIPDKYSLSQNYPNPFNPSTTIRYALPRTGVVRLAVYDVMGREIEMLVNKRQAAGSYEAAFDGSRFASGVYFYRLTTEGYGETRKMLLIR